MKFKIVTGSKFDVISAVNKCLNQGWGLHGPSTLQTIGAMTFFYQALTKPVTTSLSLNEISQLKDMHPIGKPFVYCKSCDELPFSIFCQLLIKYK